MLKPTSSQSSGCIRIHQINRKILNKCFLAARKLKAALFWDREAVLRDGIGQQ
jgi:hypothetical protein